ncbi:polyprenyl synthetase family protein [Cystobacter fuscus]|uniref:polyprenyl synthetase family protein n=1 Tax=Cystobacter fuscus TaxID=43 RepID=UPI002B2A2D8E|nr:polyprenyl synthetase family protein [Cystobacter fuscus]
MGPTPFIAAAPRLTPSVERAWLALVQAQVEGAVAELLELPDEARLDEGWARALGQTRAQLARSTQRMRPALLLAGYCLARGSTTVPAGLWRFVAGVELLHASRALHADVLAFPRPRPDGAPLHARLAPGPTGGHLAVVVGDHLFARALEVMTEANVPGAVQASQYCLRMDRSTVPGLFRREQGGVLAEQGGVRQALRLARSRMVREGLATSLVCGAMLAGADESLRLRLARVGCGLGLATLLRQESASLLEVPWGGPGDFVLGRCTFPLMAAWSRSRPEARAELEALWNLPREQKDAAVLSRVRVLVDEAGGRSATERIAARAAHGAVRALAALPNPQGLRDLMRALVGPSSQPMV